MPFIHNDASKIYSYDSQKIIDLNQKREPQIRRGLVGAMSWRAVNAKEHRHDRFEIVDLFTGPIMMSLMYLNILAAWYLLFLTACRFQKLDSCVAMM